MIKTSSNQKNLYKKEIINHNIKMPILEHIEELRHRIIKATIFFVIITVISFSYVQEISYLLKQPAAGVKFLQLAPGEYFFSSIKMSIYTGLIISSPFIIYQFVLFLLPGLTVKEAQLFLPILISSISLFFIGIYFSFTVLVPAALHFFISYGSNIVEPIWSFEQYFDFISTLIISTGLTFQIPVIQIIAGFLNIISSSKMLSYWRYILLLSTVISAILTPSTDPITQTLLALAILLLYFTGIFILKFFKK